MCDGIEQLVCFEVQQNARAGTTTTSQWTLSGDGGFFAFSFSSFSFFSLGEAGVISSPLLYESESMDQACHRSQKLREQLNLIL
jgi:hypothetical protein